MKIRRLPSWTFAAAAALLVLAWQWTTVSANYRGNWTALFYTGESQPVPAGEDVYRFHGAGYDGQLYHLMAHNAFMRGNVSATMDDPRYRYRRILVPGLAYLLALGQTGFVDRAYEVVCLIFVGLGVWWSCGIAEKAGMSRAWGLAFLAIPAVPITADRMVVDVALAALAVGFVRYAPEGSWKLAVVLGCAAVARETGLLLIGGYCAWLVGRREWRRSALFAMCATPGAAWYAYVQSYKGPSQWDFELAPLRSLVDAARHPLVYPAVTPMVSWVLGADYLAWAGLCVSFVLAVWLVLRRRDGLGMAALLFVAMGVVLRDPNPFRHVYDFGRVFSPLLVVLAAQALSDRRVVWVAPVLMMLPRIAMQVAPQVIGVWRWMGG